MRKQHDFFGIICWALALGMGGMPAAAGAGVITNSLGMALMPIKPGSFMMGQDGPAADYHMRKHPNRCDEADWDEKPVHQVTITQPFHMAATEVTLKQYRAFQPDFRPEWGENEAVRGVNWHEATAFCQWLSRKEERSYRLPTEAEWEYACRAGTTGIFFSGDQLPPASHIWFSNSKPKTWTFVKNLEMAPEYIRQRGPATLPVARHAPNAWGLYDMHGNVAEWCQDWYAPYTATPQRDPAGPPAGDFKVYRGGHNSTYSRMLRSANRSGWIPETSSERIGLRVVLAPALAVPGISPPTTSPLPAGTLPAAHPGGAQPVFEGPRPYVIIPPGSCGPFFSAHNHSPSLAECPNGDLLAIWYSCVEEGGTELNNLASRLRPGAAAWSAPELFWDGPDVNDHAPKIWWDGRQRLFHFAVGLAENIYRTSDDSGRTWSKAHIIQPRGEFGNKLLRLRDGTLVLGNDARQTSLVWSRDGGQTWQYNEVDRRAEKEARPGGRGTRYPGIHAPMVELADGRIMAISRQDDDKDQAHFNYRMPVSYSADLGKSWSYAASDFPAISSVQRAAMIRLREGPIVLCSFTDQWRDRDKRKGMRFKQADGGSFTGYGMFAALSFDEGQSWPVRRLLTPGGPEQKVNGIDRLIFPMNDTHAEPCGYLAMIQTLDGNIQLITSRNHYVFNLAWIKALPANVERN